LFAFLGIFILIHSRVAHIWEITWDTDVKPHAKINTVHFSLTNTSHLLQQKQFNPYANERPGSICTEPASDGYAVGHPKSLAFQLRTETDMRLENCWTVRLYIDVSWGSEGATLFHSAVCLLPGCW